MKNALRVLVIFAFGVGTGVMMPATWSEFRADVADDLVWISRQTDKLADWLRAIGDRITGGAREDTPLSGSVRVIDGDTLGLRGTRIRLHGIDAPESDQNCRSGGGTWACGREATRALKGRIASSPVACEERDRDRYGRAVAVCRVRGEDLNAWMVASGWALAYRTYSRAYVGEENLARKANRGMWSGNFVAPWDWRRGERLPWRPTGT